MHKSVTDALLPFAVPFPPGPTRAPWPVWRDSTTADVIFQPLTRKQAAKIYHKARAFERQTRQPGCQDGAIGTAGLKVLHSLLFDFLNFTSGALYPSYAAIAKMAGTSVSSVWRGLAKLKEAGVLNWLRRCRVEIVDGRVERHQETNAYAVLPSSQWKGFREPPEAPKPEAGTWGDHPPMPGGLDLASEVRRTGGNLTAQIAALDTEPGNPLARALAKLGRAMNR